MLTAYDYASAAYVEQAGNIDICLVGDSLAMVSCGYDSTSKLSMQEMLYHCRSVARGAKTPFLIADMPFGTYQLSVNHAVQNALQLVQEGDMEAVKLEGGVEIADKVKRMTELGIPVMGHVGLKPQQQVATSGFRVQGKTADRALRIYKDALAIQEAGAFSIVVEAVPCRLAQFITSKLSIPTIGIGAGPSCSGQVLVQLDMLGGFDRFLPRFCKRYLDLNQLASSSIREYADEVRRGVFPEEETHSYPIQDEEWEAFLARVADQK